MSKAALNMAGMCLSRDLADAGVYVGLVHPGFVASAMTSEFGVVAGEGGVITPETSAAGMLAQADGLCADNSGTFWDATTGDVLPW